MRNQSQNHLRTPTQVNKDSIRDTLPDRDEFKEPESELLSTPTQVKEQILLVILSPTETDMRNQSQNHGELRYR